MKKVWLSPILALSITLALASCGEQNPNVNTATSGRMILLVEEGYADLFEGFADRFEERVGSATIEVRSVTARAGVEEMINTFLADTARSDTAVSISLIMARDLLPDERQLLEERNLAERLSTVLIGYDGLALAVAEQSPIEEGTVDGLRLALDREDPTANDLMPGGPTTTLRFLFGSPNSGPYAFVRDSLLDSDSSRPAAPASWVDDPSELVAKVAAGEGVGISGWYLLSDSTAGIRTLRMSRTVGSGERAPVRVHVTSLVMGIYPMKIPIIGFTLGPTNSLGNGFLQWVGLSEEPQRELATIGLEPENVRFEFTTEE